MCKVATASSNRWMILLLALMVLPVRAGAQDLQQRWSVAFSCDSTYVATCGDRIRIHDFESGKLLRAIEGEDTDCIAFSTADPELFAVADDKKTVRLWRVKVDECIRVFDDHDGYMGSLAFDTSGKYLASTSSEGDCNTRTFGQLRVWEIETGELVHSLDVEDGKLNGLSFSADGKQAAMCREVKGEASFVDVYQLPDWQRTSSIKISAGKELEENEWGKAVPKGQVTGFTSDGKHVLVAGGICVRANPHGYAYACKPTMVLWRADLADESATRLMVDSERYHCTAIDVTPDGKGVVCGNGPLTMRDVASGTSLWTKAFARGAALSPDGRFVAGGQAAGLLILNAQTGETIRSLASDN